MRDIFLSVVMPTHNRQEILRKGPTTLRNRLSPGVGSKIIVVNQEDGLLSAPAGLLNPAIIARVWQSQPSGKQVLVAHPPTLER